MARNKRYSNARALQNRRREIRANLANINESNSNPQPDCPLFAKLPAEIRLKVFELALSEHEDLSRPIMTDNFFYRPRYFFKTRIFTDLLRTCRRIYAEASNIPMISATHTLSACDTFPGRNPNFISWTAKNFSEFSYLQLFGKLESWAERLQRIAPPDPKVLTITTRFVDWDLEAGGLVTCLPEEWIRQLWSFTTHCTVSAENALPIKGTGKLQEVRIEFEAHLRQEQQLRDFAAMIINRELNKTVGVYTLSVSVRQEGGVKPNFTLDPNRVTLEKWTSPFKPFVRDTSSKAVRQISGHYVVVTFVFTECCHCDDCEPGSGQQICKRRLKRATSAEDAITDITPRSWYAEYGQNGSEEQSRDVEAYKPVAVYSN